MAAQQKAIVDKLLTNASSMFRPEGYVSEMVLPIVNSVQKTGLLAKYGNDHIRVENSIIGGDGKYRRAETITRDSESYNIAGYGLEGIVTEDDYSNVEKPYDAEKDEVLGLTTTIMTGKEKGLADTLGDTSILTQNVTLAGTQQFNDYANSDPIDRFNTARSAVKAGCGIAPDAAIMSWEVFQQLKFHPGILDALGYKDNRPGGLKGSELASVMEVKRILIAEASYNAAIKGQDDDLQPIWGKNIIFGKIPTVAQKRQTSLGYYFKLAGRGARRVTKWAVNNPPNSKSILVDDHYDMRITNASAGYLIKNAIA
ncbi:hypothetical protein KAR91_40750 [Candidatus Pacearchaeota archaeon]|nr:hypothetical protein [Candidatus Pacearchaeota archaeon]